MTKNALHFECNIQWTWMLTQVSRSEVHKLSSIKILFITSTDASIKERIKQRCVKASKLFPFLTCVNILGVAGLGSDKISTRYSA